MTGPEKALCESLGYRFKTPGLLRQALTHRSAEGPDNERLEFLGDGLLNAVVAEDLYRRHPDLEEGDLSRLRANLVNQESLAEVAREIGLGDCLILGPGEMKSGGQRRASILADSLEALLGAVFLDAGFEAVRGVALRLLAQRLASPPSTDSLKDPKTRLQELLQARNLPLPTYTIHSVTGEAHRQTFRVRCSVEELDAMAEGEGGSRRSAEQEAARIVLEQISHEP